jgi:hypothetical protein
MARQIVDINTVQPNGKKGEPAPSAFAKLNANDGELYTLVGIGGIVDSGSNANGSYVKYADGTMECWGISPNAVAVNTAAGGVFHSASAVVFQFAVAFANVPSIVPSTITSSGFYSWAAFEGGASPSSFGCRAVSPSNNASAYLCYIARGRWK